MGLEIERRILLKKLPYLEYDEIHEINQYYGPTGRLRRVEIFDPKKNSDSGIVKYIRTVKTLISDGVNEEDEEELSKKQFYLEVKNCEKHISKKRFIKNIGKYKWEIDIFSNFHLIIAEIEVKTKEELRSVNIPSFIKENMILDITGLKEFSNFILAEKWNYLEAYK